jgi:hypothetical protein
VNSLKFFTRRGGDRRPQSSCNRPVNYYCYDICTRHIFLNGVKLNNSIEKYAGDMRFSPDLHATVLQDSGSLTLICDGSLRQTWPKKLEKMTLQGGASGSCRAFLTIYRQSLVCFLIHLHSRLPNARGMLQTHVQYIVQQTLNMTTSFSFPIVLLTLQIGLLRLESILYKSRVHMLVKREDETMSHIVLSKDKQ